MSLDLHRLPKRLRKKQAKLYAILASPLLRYAYPHDIINQLVQVQPLPKGAVLTYEKKV